MVNPQDLLEWGHSNLKVPYFRLAEEITAAGKGKINTEKIKLLFSPFKPEAKIAAAFSNHFYPPLMESPIINAVMLVTESTNKGIIRILTEEYDIGTLEPGFTGNVPMMVVKDYKPPEVEPIEKLLQKRDYQGILNFMEKERGTNWNCLKIGSLQMLEEMRIIEKISNETGDFMEFFFQTLVSLQKLYSTGDFYVYPENKFPIFYFWQNYFGKWTHSIDYHSLKLFISQLLPAQKLNITINADGSPLFNLLIQFTEKKLFIDLVPPQIFSKLESSGNHIVNRQWDSLKSVETLKTIIKSKSLKELFLNSVDYMANFAISRLSKEKKVNTNEKNKRNEFYNLFSKDLIDKIMFDFMGSLNDADRIWTLILADGIDNGTPLIGFESEIHDHFPILITGLNETDLRIAFEKKIPFKQVKLKILLNQNSLIRLRTEILGIKLPEQLKKIESFLLHGMEIVPEPIFIKYLRNKGLLSTLYHSFPKRLKKTSP